MILRLNLTKSLHKMYFLNKFCCICMNKSDLKHLFDVDNEGVSHYNKLTSSIDEMNFKEMNDQRFICGECCVTLNIVYNFRQICLRSKTNLITCISQLQTFSHVSGTFSVRLTDIKHQIKVVKEKIYIKYENEASSSSLEESNPLSEFKTESYEEIIQFPASVKEECESEEDSSVYEDATVDHVNEGQSTIEDGPHSLHSEIDIKEEPTSDSETPQDGSTSPRPHKCVVCKKSFKKKSQFNIHIRIHSEKKPYECDICKKGFVRRSDVPRHRRIHTGEKPYECEVCKKKFADRSNLVTHTRIHSGEKPYKCEVCKKSFKANGDLIAHMRSHSGEKPYACQICKNSFNRKKQLQEHVQIHSDRKPYKCDICNKGFARRRYLPRHMRKHTGEKLYECEVCNKKFSEKSCLIPHMRVHSGEKPYVCQICNRNFNQKTSLKVHLQIHYGERPYQCEICKKSFTLNVTLTRHMIVHSKETK